MLKEKNAVITGAARGIGKAIALEFAKNGANLVLSGRNEASLEKICSNLNSYGVKTLYTVGDIQYTDNAKSLVDMCLSNLGSIDILVNNAGITRDNLLIRMKEEDWDDVININLKGTYNTIKAASKAFMKQKAGKIINISSVVGVIGNAGQVNYAASKAGVIGLTKSVAKEMASRNINVNTVAPGYISTDMTASIPQEKKEELSKLIPLGRLGSSQAIADMVLFLASDKASYITGQTIHVDGGMVI